MKANVREAVWLHSVLNLAVDKVNGQLHAPVALFPRKAPPIAIEYQIG